MSPNEKEIELLNSSPQDLIILYQSLIEIIVTRFIKSGGFHITEKDEIIQIINERLLLSSEKIKKQYKAISLLRTYYACIIRNICLEEINKKKRVKFSELDTSKHQSTFTDSLNEGLYLGEEFNRLGKILETFNKNLNKLILCLKIIYRLPLSIEDIKKYSFRVKDNEIHELKEAVHPVKIIPEFELFQIITPFINKYEKKDNKPDALRRWTARKIDEIIFLMNGEPPRAFYDKETIQILLEKFFTKNVQKQFKNNLNIKIENKW